jgi:predicted Zn-dependent protease
MKAQPLVYVVFAMIAATTWGDRRTELEAQVHQIMKLDNVEMRRQVGPLFELADLYLEQNEDDSALRLYELALRVDSLNFACQVKHAGLLLKKGQRDQAIEKLNLASQYAEDFDVITQARSLLAAEGAAGESSKPVDHLADPILYLVPIGKVNPVLLKETAAELTGVLHLDVVITDKLDIDLGPFDRTQADKVVRGIAERMQENMPAEEFNRRRRLFSLGSIENAGYEDVKRFVKAFVKELGPAKDYAAFCSQLDDLEKEGQYDASRLLDVFSKRLPPVPGSIGYLCITDFDLYGWNSNFVFGNAMKGMGVISYHRFTAAFNETAQNRPRLVQRTVKQAASSTFFVMGIPRCSTPMCIRAYPNSLDEHDAKQAAPCTGCKQQLEALRAKYKEN